MTTQVIIGLILWAVPLVLCGIFGKLVVNKVDIKSPVVRFFILLLIIPLVGIILGGIGWLFTLVGSAFEQVGRTIISPLIYFL